MSLQLHRGIIQNFCFAKALSELFFSCVWTPKHTGQNSKNIVSQPYIFSDFSPVCYDVRQSGLTFYYIVLTNKSFPSLKFPSSSEPRKTQSNKILLRPKLAFSTAIFVYNCVRFLPQKTEMSIRLGTDKHLVNLTVLLRVYYLN